MVSDTEQSSSSTTENVTPNKRKVSEAGIDLESESDLQPAKRFFKPISADTAYDWELPQDMLDHAIEQFHTFYPEQTLKESVLSMRPVPSNMIKVPTLDDFIRGLMFQNKKHTEVQMDKVLQNVQKKIMHIMGPLSSMWFTLQKVMETPAEESTTTELSIEDLLQEVQMMVTLTGQSFNSVL